MKTILITSALVASLFTVSAVAQAPMQNIAPWRHGNLAAAQELSAQAFDRLTAAQQANGFDLGGHAGRAKEFLRRANVEMKLAAQVANWH